jgi:hypothetical protein
MRNSQANELSRAFHAPAEKGAVGREEVALDLVGWVVVDLAEAGSAVEVTAAAESNANTHRSQ